VCRPASFVLTKDRVFWSKRSDSHEDIIQQFGLHADGVGGPNIVRIEITPENGDLSSDPSTWKFRLDQDELPEWATPEECETRGRATLLEWVAEKIVTHGERDVRDGEVYACGSSSVMACGSSSVTAYDSSSVTAYDSSSVKAYGSSSVKACGSSSVKAYDSSSVEAYDYSSVTAYDYSSVEAYGSSSVTAYGSSSVTAYGSSSVTACGSSSVTAYGSSSVTAYGSSSVTAYGSSSVKACGSSSVKACEQYATVRHYSSTTPVKPVGPHAVVVDSRGQKSICIQDC
jgi:hypothetical protein